MSTPSPLLMPTRTLIRSILLGGVWAGVWAGVWVGVDDLPDALVEARRPLGVRRVHRAEGHEDVPRPTRGGVAAMHQRRGVCEEVASGGA